MAEPMDRLIVQLETDTDDPEQTELLRMRLQEELRELGVRAEPAPGEPAPDGSRAIDAIALGTLIVAVADKTGLLDALVSTVRRWWGRQPPQASRIRLEMAGDVLELERASPAEQERLIQQWLDRQAARAGDRA
jgi:hypothetical protein